jgi:hypothetical protein
MNNTTSPNFIYFPLKFWYRQFGFGLYQDIVSLSMSVTGTIGIVLNVLTLVILRSRAFDLKLYTYLRVYVVNSIFICFWTAGIFMIMSRNVFKFPNTFIPNFYHSILPLPLLSLSYIFEGFIDTLMSFERVTLLSNRFNWFNKRKPMFYCAISGFVSILTIIPYYFYYKVIKIVIPLNEIQVIELNYVGRLSHAIILERYENIFFCINDISPVILQIILSISAIILMKSYLKNRSRMTNLNLVRINNVIPTQVHTPNDEARKRARKMEIKLTILVIVLTILSAL